MPDWFVGAGNWTENSPTWEGFIGAALTFTVVEHPGVWCFKRPM